MVSHERGVQFTDRLLANTILLLMPSVVRPNLVTVIRMVSVPFIFFFLYYGEYTIGGVLFALSAFTDALDGAMARTRDQVTDWGKIWDPIADKLLIGSIGCLLIARYISITLALIIIAIEVFLITNGAYRKYVMKQDVSAEWAGKIKMVLQVVGVGMIPMYALSGHIAVLTTATAVLYAAVLFALMSLIVYRGV